MNMSFQDREEPEWEFVDRRRAEPHLLEHRIDQDRLAIVAVAEQIGVDRRLRVEQLPEDGTIIARTGGRRAVPRR